MILYEDNHLLVVNKPAPMLTQAPPEVPSLEAMVKSYLKDKYAKPGNVYLGIPHRLDRPVSGVILFARNSKAAARLAEQFQKHTVDKTYWAIVERRPEPAEGEWRDWLRKIANESRAEIATENDGRETEDIKEAITLYRTVVDAPDNACLLELTPKTGRTHQLRVQAAARGLPIFGDSLYGSTRDFGPVAETPRDRVIALHARRIRFLHPLSYQEVTFEAEPPEWWPDWIRSVQVNTPV